MSLEEDENNREKVKKGKEAQKPTYPFKGSKQSK